MNINDIAKICHESNRLYCQALGDNSQVPWDEAQQWQRDSAINVVQFHIDCPDATDSASHENWLKEKEADGWVYHSEKIAERKMHPCIMPFDDLPEEQKTKDKLFISICTVLIPTLT